jgi:hypothetical protein
MSIFKQTAIGGKRDDRDAPQPANASEPQIDAAVTAGSVLTGAMAGWIDEDIPAFLRELEVLSSALREHGGEIREALARCGDIKEAPGQAPALSVGAVDCADVRQNCGDVVTVLALGVRVEPRQRPHYVPKRKTGANTDAMRQLAPALRLLVETSLIGEAENPVIVDNSWWSFLMDTNKVITTHYNLSAADGKEVWEDVIRGLCGENGSFVSALYNPHAVAISKSGTSQVISKQAGFKHFFQAPVSDLALFSSVLREGEYVRPRLIKEMTEGHAGVEARGWSAADRKRVFERFRGEGGLQVTYFKPWAFKKAYRLEFDPGRFRGEAFDSLLAGIRTETRFPTLVEPIPQLLADRLSKQVAGLARLYGNIHAPKFPEIFFETRTK